MKISSFAITVAAAQVPYVASQVKRLRSKDQRSKATGATVDWGRNNAEAVVEPHRARAVPKNNVLPVSSAEENQFLKSDAFDQSYNSDGSVTPPPAPLACGSGCPSGFTGNRPNVGCDGFYTCQYGVQTSSTPCPAGTKYDSSLDICNWAQSVTCNC